MVEKIKLNLKQNKKVWIAGSCCLLGMIAALIGWSLQRPAAASQPVQSVNFVMDTLLQQTGYDRDDQKTFDAVNAEMQRIESVFSVYQAESEISKINQNAGKQPVAVSDQVYRLLQQSVALCAEQKGCFDISLGSVIGLWGIGSDQQRVPSEAEIAAALTATGYQSIVFDDQTHTVYLPDPQMRLDLGGIIKGYASDCAAQLYQKNQVDAVLFSFQSSIYTCGRKPDGSRFTLGIKDPRGSVNDYLGTLEVENCFVGSSGDNERYFEQDGIRYHHILDPKTGYPARTGLLSVTVVADSGLEADCLSTALFVAGKEYLLAHLDDYAVVAVDDQQNVYLSESLRDCFHPNQESGYHFH